MTAVDLHVETLPSRERDRATLESFLDAQELARAGRMRPAVASAWRLGRGLVKEALARRLGRPPGALVLEADARGRPWVPGAPSLGVSVAHTDGLVVVAVAEHVDVGVDVEALRPFPAWRGVAEVVFGARDRARLAALSDPLPAFWRLWTAREALAKLTGKGLDDEASRFELPLALCTEWRASGWTRGAARPAHVEAFPLASGHVLALAVRPRDVPDRVTAPRRSLPWRSPRPSTTRSTT